jgi:hypothetical protein
MNRVSIIHDLVDLFMGISVAERDDFSSNGPPALIIWWSMILCDALYLLEAAVPISATNCETLAPFSPQTTKPKNLASK